MRLSNHASWVCEQVCHNMAHLKDRDCAQRGVKSMAAAPEGQRMCTDGCEGYGRRT